MAQKKITQEELVTNDGKNGKPAWFAYKGKVYDVTAEQLLDGRPTHGHARRRQRLN